MFDPTTLTGFHTIASLVAIAAGFIAVFDIMGSRPRLFWSALFWLTAFITSATGFLFPFSVLLPSHIVGIIALVVMAVALLARFGLGFAGAGRWMYALSAVVSLYLLVFVAIAQLFLKVPELRALAPTQTEPAFAGAHLAGLAVFILLAIGAARSFRPVTD